MKRMNAIVMAAVMLLLCSCGSNSTGQDSKSVDNNGQTEVWQEETDAAEESDINDTEGNDTGNLTKVPLPEEFVLIQGGTFQMGSPEEEAWRSEDEVRHTVTVSDFYMSAYELTQAEYQEITGENPSSFLGEDLPVENISWLDAVSYCNAGSEREGLMPVYTVDGTDVTWDRSADGYRLPTEAEWGYARRAGTTTPFNTETSISAEEQTDPTGAETGTLRVYRGGGWNDFAKNMCSAYRAALGGDKSSFNIGIRLVRNVVSGTGSVTSAGIEHTESAGGKVLIAFFSWGGNTKGIAEEIQTQTGADLFEITLVNPYSNDYNTVLDEAQRDQNEQARPELAVHVENMEEYDTVILGYAGGIIGLNQEKPINGVLPVK